MVNAGRLRVRAAVIEDAPAIRAIYAPAVEQTAISFESETPSVEEMARRMGAGPLPLPWLVATDGEAVVGYTYGAPHRDRAAYRWSVETSVYVGEATRGLGVGRRLYASLLPLLAELGYASAYAGIAVPNPASVALHESIGFRHIGTFPQVGFKHGRWHDTGWWWRPLAEPARAPAAPRPWDGSAHR